MNYKINTNSLKIFLVLNVVLITGCAKFFAASFERNMDGFDNIIKTSEKYTITNFLFGKKATSASLIEFIDTGKVLKRSKITDDEFAHVIKDFKYAMDNQLAEADVAILRDPWGSKYYYEIIDNVFIMGTWGRDQRCSYKSIQLLEEKLLYGKLNCFKDDIFIKVNLLNNT